MALSDFSNVVVSGDGAALTQVGFGTLLLACYHTISPGTRTIVATSLTDLTDAGFSTFSRAYKMAQVAFAQSPRVQRVKIGRLANAPTLTYRLTPVQFNSTAYQITVEVAGQVPTTISYTSDANATVDEICDGIQAAFGTAGAPVAAITVTPSGGTATHLDISAAQGVFFSLSDWDHTRLLVEDRTPDPGIAADLDAIRTADNDWYGLAVADNSPAICEEAADWAETQDVIFACNTSNSNALNSGVSTDIQSVLKAKSYARTMCLFDLDDTAGYAGVAALAERFPFDPGSPPDAGGVFNAKTLRGVTADPLTPTQKTNLRNKGYTVIVTTAGRNHTLGGESASGEYLDYTRFNDWFRIRLQEKLAAVQLNNGRVPYDEVGLSMIESACRAQVSEGLRSKGVSALDADGRPPSVTIPKMSETAQNDRAARKLRNVLIEYKYAGAIQVVDPVRITVRL